jgi:hypothetical protein
MESGKRQYNKKSEYWTKFEKQEQPIASKPTNLLETLASCEPELCGEPFYVSQSSVNVSTASDYSRTDVSWERSGSRKNRAAVSKTVDRFGSIRNGLLPYSFAIDGVNVREAIELCQKAYANVAIFRNAIDIMSEFANSDIYLEGGSQKSRDFFYEWFKKIKIWKVKDQYFREYYRSGNIFIYRIDGKFKLDDFAELSNRIGNGVGAKNEIPIRYIMLNPFDIVAKTSSSFAVGLYEKVLSQYELSRLQNPSNEDDKEILRNLPKELRDGIENGSYYTNGLKIQLDPEKLSFSFYKKQDYEPFAVPFGYPVLEDINTKMELKKMDHAITRTVENVILLITMGAEPDKGGINQNNVKAMQTLFKNESVGRVLVSDYTTKAQFVIPDLNKVLGAEKYKVLNEDIKQGLQNIVIGEEKYSATEVKAQIFIDRLKESRNAFLNDFLQVEIKRIAKSIGLKNYPTAKFRDIDIRDQTQLMRVTTRLMELGVLTPQQGMDMFHTGEFPKSEEIAPAQEEFIKNRKSGYYNPIVGGVPTTSPPKDPNAAAKTAAVNKTNKVAGRPQGTTGIPVVKANFSVKDIQKVVQKIEETRGSIENELKKKFNTEKFNAQQVQMIDKLCEAIVVSQDIKTWESTANSCVNNFEEISSLAIMPEVLSIVAEHELEDDYSAALLYHSQKINEN